MNPEFNAPSSSSKSDNPDKSKRGFLKALGFAALGVVAAPTLIKTKEEIDEQNSIFSRIESDISNKFIDQDLQIEVARDLFTEMQNKEVKFFEVVRTTKNEDQCDDFHWSEIEYLDKIINKGNSNPERRIYKMDLLNFKGIL